MPNELTKRKSGWYVTKFKKNNEVRILKYDSINEKWKREYYVDENSHIENSVVEKGCSINETEIFSQLKERDEMRELIQELVECLDSDVCDKTDFEPTITNLLNRAKQFIK